jgi:type II secretory pathway component PulC
MSTRLILAILLVLGLTSCASIKNKQAATTAQVDGKKSLPDNIQVIRNLVKREEYKNSILFGGNTNSIRLPEIYQRGLEQDEKQYRFFDIKPGSVYEMLGLQNADTLVLVEGYMVPNQTGFYGYISVLHNEKESNIQIIRKGAPILLNNTFVP